MWCGHPVGHFEWKYDHLKGMTCPQLTAVTAAHLLGQLNIWDLLKALIWKFSLDKFNSSVFWTVALTELCLDAVSFARELVWSAIQADAGNLQYASQATLCWIRIAVIAVDDSRWFPFIFLQRARASKWAFVNWHWVRTMWISMWQTRQWKPVLFGVFFWWIPWRCCLQHVLALKNPRA